MKFGARFLSLWLDTSWYVFWAQVVQMQFLSPTPQGQEIFWDLMILFDLSYDSEENEVLFVKNGAMVLELWPDKSFEPKLP